MLPPAKKKKIPFSQSVSQRLVETSQLYCQSMFCCVWVINQCERIVGKGGGRKEEERGEEDDSMKNQEINQLLMSGYHSVSSVMLSVLHHGTNNFVHTYCGNICTIHVV